MTNPRKILASAAAGLAVAAALSTAAAAHHSYSMFDRTKTQVLNGTVRAWEMTNPHSYLWVVVMKPDSSTEVWGLEGAGVAALQRNGIHKSEVKPGDKISVSMHPMRDGRTGGQLVALTVGETGKKVDFGGGGGEPGKAAAE